MISVKPHVPNGMRDNFGNEWDSITSLAKELHVQRYRLGRILKEEGAFKHNGKVYTLKSTPVIQIDNTMEDFDGGYINNKVTPALDNELHITKEEYENFKALKNASELPFEKFDIKFKDHKKGVRYAIALFSDAHIEETVDPASVLGKN